MHRILILIFLFFHSFGFSQKDFQKYREDQIYFSLYYNSLGSELDNFKENKFSWKRTRDSEAKRSQTKDDSDTKKLKDYATQLQARIRDFGQESRDLPVFGYYGTGRLWKEKRLVESKRDSRTNIINTRIRTSAYIDCLDPASSFKQFEDWFIAEYKHDFDKRMIAVERGATNLPKVNDTILVEIGRAHV